MAHDASTDVDGPLTADMLQDATWVEKKRIIGEILYQKVCEIESTRKLAGKITECRKVLSQED